MGRHSNIKVQGLWAVPYRDRRNRKNGADLHIREKSSNFAG